MSSCAQRHICMCGDICHHMTEEGMYICGEGECILTCILTCLETGTCVCMWICIFMCLGNVCEWRHAFSCTWRHTCSMLGVYSVYVEVCIASSQGHVSYHACQLPLYSPETMPAASRQGLTVSKLIFNFHIYRIPLCNQQSSKNPEVIYIRKMGSVELGAVTP